MDGALPLLMPQWPAPAGVRALTTRRHGAGVSLPPFDQFNLGNRHAADGDQPAHVERNRALLHAGLALPSPAHWLRQVHGTTVLRFDAAPVAGASEPVADAAVTSVPGVVLAILWWMFLDAPVSSGLTSMAPIGLEPVASDRFGGFLLAIVIGVPMGVAKSVPLCGRTLPVTGCNRRGLNASVMRYFCASGMRIKLRSRLSPFAA